MRKTILIALKSNARKNMKERKIRKEKKKEKIKNKKSLDHVLTY